MKNHTKSIDGLFGKTRQAVLSLLYGRTDSSFYTKQIMDAVGSGRGGVQRELKNLTDAGIIVREERGRQVYYRANQTNAIFNELFSMIEKAGANNTGINKSGDLSFERRFNLPGPMLAQFCLRHHINKLALFGSVLRENFSPNSDIDVLVEFEKGHVPGFGIIAMQNELGSLVGRKIDLRTPADLSRYFRAEVVREAKVQYEHTQP